MGLFYILDSGGSDQVYSVTLRWNTLQCYQRLGQERFSLLPILLHNSCKSLSQLTTLSHLYPKMLFLCAVLVLLFPLCSPENLCSTDGLCCSHRSNDCVVQKVLFNNSIDTNNKPCYCDQACHHMRDCCQDYNTFCKTTGWLCCNFTVTQLQMRKYYWFYFHST